MTRTRTIDEISLRSSLRIDPILTELYDSTSKISNIENLKNMRKSKDDISSYISIVKKRYLQ